jgi:hypothetical protein
LQIRPKAGKTGSGPSSAANAVGLKGSPDGTPAGLLLSKLYLFHQSLQGYQYGFGDFALAALPLVDDALLHIQVGSNVGSTQARLFDKATKFDGIICQHFYTHVFLNQH